MHVSRLARGDFFGEELLNGTVATKMVCARTTCKLSVLLKSDFEAFLRRFPDLAQHIMRTKLKAEGRRKEHQLSTAVAQSSRRTSPLRRLRRATLFGCISSERSERARSNTTQSDAAVLKRDDFIRLPAKYDEMGDYDILLLRAEWLIQQWHAGKRLERRQDLPPEAFYRGAVELRAIVAIS